MPGLCPLARESMESDMPTFLVYYLYLQVLSGVQRQTPITHSSVQGFYRASELRPLRCSCLQALRICTIALALRTKC